MARTFPSKEEGKLSVLTIKIQGQIGTCKINADIEAGTGVTALYGPSGAGKSTILRALAGLWEPSAGLIKVRERTLFDSEININMPAEKRRMGAVFQDPLLFPHLSVEKNLRFGMKPNEVGWDAVLTMLDLHDLTSRMPRHLSGGEAQRVALARAILSDPQVLLLDEPMTGLDDERRAQVLPYLERLRDETIIPIVYVSHRRDEIMQLADLIFIVDGGTAEKELTPYEFDQATKVVTTKRRDEA